MDSINNKINENDIDKINKENNISNIDINKSNELKISQNENNDLLDKIGNFNIDENEDEDEEEQNDAYIQELVKQGKYSEVIKFLESKDKKEKRKKIGENGENLDYNEDEELVIIPADNISDLHEDNNNNSNNENLEEDNLKNNLVLENNIINTNIWKREFLKSIIHIINFIWENIF